MCFIMPIAQLKTDLRQIGFLNPSNDIFQDSILQLKANYLKKLEKV
jgi:hypothetical protein